MERVVELGSGIILVKGGLFSIQLAVGGRLSLFGAGAREAEGKGRRDVRVVY